MKGRKRNPLSAEKSVFGYAGDDQWPLYPHSLLTYTEQKSVVFKQLNEPGNQFKRKEAMQTSQMIFLPRSGIDPPAFRPERQESNNQWDPVNPV